VTSVALAVGYESTSQFTREYARQFGLPPAKDAARLRLVSVASPRTTFIDHHGTWIGTGTSGAVR
jgi:AraC-like DNA-binding protein